MKNHGVSALSAIVDLGPDVDLLLRSDQWLENHYKDLAARIHLLASELNSIMLAKHFKVRMQQHNQVAVRTVKHDDQGQVTDVDLRLMPLQDAISHVAQTADRNVIESHFATWNSDGYDLETSAQLRGLG